MRADRMKSLRVLGWCLILLALAVAAATPILVAHGTMAAEPGIVIGLALLLTGLIVLGA
jgi:hypothetical protein